MKKKYMIGIGIAIAIIIGVIIVQYTVVYSNQNNPGAPNQSSNTNPPQVPPKGKHITIDLNESMPLASH